MGNCVHTRMVNFSFHFQMNTTTLTLVAITPKDSLPIHFHYPRARIIDLPHPQSYIIYHPDAY